MIHRHTLGFFSLIAWYVCIPLVLSIDQVLGGFYFSFLDSITYLISITLFVWMLGNVILAVKIPILQNFIPYDKRIQVHILSSFGILAAFLFHALSKLLGGYFIDVIAWSLLVVVSFLFLLSWYWIRVPIFSFVQKLVAIITKRESKSQYDWLKLVHGIGFRLLTILMYLHVNRSSIEEKGLVLSQYAYLTLFLCTLLVVLAGYIYRAARPKGVVDAVIQKEGLTIIRIALRKSLSYRAGQFAFLSFPKNKELKGTHPFSFLSSPGDGGDTLSFGIKTEGDFTEKLTSLDQGAPVHVDAPYGAFFPPRNKKICLIGTGIGIVPMLSILGSRTIAAEQLYAIFSVRNKHEIPFIPGHHIELKESALSSDTPEFSPGYQETTQELVGNIILVETAQQPRISAEHFLQLPGEITEYVFYLCSSPKVRSTIVDILHSLRVQPSRIVYEKFSF